MDASKHQPIPPGTDLDALARTESMIARCEARITAQLQLLASLSPWEPNFMAVRREVDVEEVVLKSLRAQQQRLLAVVKGLPP